MHIAQEYLLPQAFEKSGVSKDQVTVTEDAIMQIIRWYAREAGVRNLGKYVDRIFRKAALKLVKGEEKVVVDLDLAEAAKARAVGLAGLVEETGPGKAGEAKTEEPRRWAACFTALPKPPRWRVRRWTWAFISRFPGY